MPDTIMGSLKTKEAHGQFIHMETPQVFTWEAS